MPRHMLPQVGTTVWYFTDPTRRPMAAIVTKRVSYSSFNLTYFAAQTGTATAVTAVAFLENPALRSASGAYCTPTGIQDDVDGATDVTSATQRATAVASFVAGGTGYVVGDILTVATTGGATFRVTTAAGGIVSAGTIVNGGSVTKPGPAGTLATTGGTGTGCTVTITWTDN